VTLAFANRTTSVYDEVELFERNTLVKLSSGDPVVVLGERAAGEFLIFDPNDGKTKTQATIFIKVLSTRGVGWVAASDVSNAP
jgi:hypothetical protein